MKRVFLILSIAALALPATALAKGPSAASLSGPGNGGGIDFPGGGESGGTPLGDLTQQAGFFPAAFGQAPDPMLAGRPSGDLGPRYRITYTVPGPNTVDKVRQEIYPYAPDGPVTYMKPGQRFFGTEETRGGWFQADRRLKHILVSAGLPAVRAAPASPDGFSLSTGIATLLAAALVLAAATATVMLRRRTGPAAAQP